MNIINLNQQYLSFSNPNTRILAIQSPKGSGKSRWMADNLSDVPALFLTHRISLSKDLANRTQSAHYKDNSAYSSKRLVICVNSLMTLLHSDTHKGTTLVIDESTQVLRHLIGETCSSNRQAILNTLARKVYHCKQLVLMDADMNQETLDYFVNLFNYKDIQVTPEDITWVHNTFNTKKKSFIEYPTSESLQLAVIHDLKAGLNCYIACDTQTRVDTLNSLIDVSKIDLKGKLTVHGGNSGESEQAEFVANVNELQKNYQAVIASPSLFTGVDINQPHFDKVYLFADGAAATATDLLQASARVRTVPEVRFWVTSKTSSEPTDWQEILSIKEHIAFSSDDNPFALYDLKQLRNGDIWAMDYDPATGTSTVRDSVYMNMFCQLLALSNQSLNNLQGSFLKAASLEGKVVTHQLSEAEVKQAEAVKAASKVIRKQNKESKQQAILNADILAPEKLFLQDIDSSVLSAEETMSVKKQRLLNLIGGLSEYLPEAVKHENRMFKAVYFQGLLTRSVESLAAEDQRDLAKAPSDRKYRVKTLNLIQEFLKVINYAGSLKGEELSAFYCASEVQQIYICNYRWFTEKAIEFKELLNVSVPKDVEDKPFQFIQSVLGVLGLSVVGKQARCLKKDVMVANFGFGSYDRESTERVKVRKYYVDQASVKMMAAILKAREAQFTQQKEAELEEAYF
jgi:hypothetical protein